MEFRLGASLWNNVADTQAPTPARQPASGFNQKLQLPTPQQAELQPPQDPAQQRHMDSLWQSAPLPLSRQKGALRTELYGWGALAGHHLSQVVGPAEQRTAPSLSALFPASINAEATGLDVHTQQGALGDQLAGAVSRSNATPLMQPSAEREPAGAMGGTTEPSAELSRFFQQRWPERRLLLLPRQSGVDVVVRDFHLSAHEQQAVATDLRAFISRSGSLVEQIWVNGRCVWQR